MRTLALLLLLVCTFTYAAEPTAKPPELTPNTWVKLLESAKGDAVYFGRQAHGGSCFDTVRGRLILFGSNSHGKNFYNSPFLFDPNARAWTQLYPHDAKATYQVTPEGLAVAGEGGKHPWATHTFGALVYDESRDEVLSCIFDDHLVPGRFTSEFATQWPLIKRKPTWSLNLKTNEWSALPGDGINFFPYCATYCSDRKSVIGVRSDGVFELAGEPRAWKKINPKGVFGYHTNCAYDRKNKAVVIFGSHENRNEIAAFWPEKSELKIMPTTGERPPKDQHNPMEYHPLLEQTVILIDHVDNPAIGEGKGTTETWLYDLGKDAWTQVKTATLPMALGMNYNMEYDPKLNAMLLVSGNEGGPATVWALKLEAAK